MNWSSPSPTPACADSAAQPAATKSSTYSHYVAAVGTGDSAAVIASIRDAERESYPLDEQGFKQHDDATLIAATFDR